MENVLLFIVLLLISGAVWFIDRLGRAAQAREEGPPPRPRSARGPRPRPGAEAPLGAAPAEPTPLRRPPLLRIPDHERDTPPPSRPPLFRIPGLEPASAAREVPPAATRPPIDLTSPVSERPRAMPPPRVPAPPPRRAPMPPPRAPMPVSRAMRQRVHRHDAPRTIDRMGRQPSRARRISVERARDGMVISAILGPCRGLEPFQ